MDYVGMDPDQADEIISEIRAHALPDSLGELIDEYDAAVGDRDRFLWKWLHALFPAFTFSCLDPRYAADVRDAKLAASMFVATLDDLAEKHGDEVTFEEAAKIPFSSQSVERGREGADAAVLEFAEAAWGELESRLAVGPRTDEFREIFEFDVRQMLNAIRYSALVNQHLGMTNLAEAERFDSQNMMLFVYGDIDLCFSPAFGRDDLSPLRRFLWSAQRMARIGNWITTWKRELGEGDFSSGVIVYALENGLVSEGDLTALRSDPGDDDLQQIVAQIRDHEVEDALVDRREDAHLDAKALGSRLETVDADTFLDGMETVFRYHLASRGLK